MVNFAFKFCLIIVVILKIELGYSIENQLKQITNDGNIRKTRALLFPVNSAIGILTAIAIPLNIPHRNVFYSYNFEANYNEPSKASDFFPGIWQRFTGLGRSLKCDANLTDTCTNPIISVNNEQRSKRKWERPLITRKEFYEMLINKFKSAGFNGKQCLLRMICEVNRSAIGTYNGVLGSIFHIIFSPTTSTDETVSRIYYEAEENGLLGKCQKYKMKCNKNILNLITKKHQLLF